MSWEDGIPERHPCPCGNGHYTVTMRSDDWGRFEERWEMHCAACREDFSLYSYEYSRKGLTSTQYGWAPKKLVEELDELTRTIERQKQECSEYLVRKYSKPWRDHFSNRKKNAIWAELTHNGDTYPSLATFYSHVKHSSLDGVLTRYLSHHEANTVMRILNLKDNDLNMSLAGISAQESKAARQEERIRENLFS